MRCSKCGKLIKGDDDIFYARNSRQEGLYCLCRECEKGEEGRVFQVPEEVL